MSALFRIVHEPHPPMPPGISDVLVDFLGLCFRKDVMQRPSARRLRTHRWLSTPQQIEPASSAAGMGVSASGYGASELTLSELIDQKRMDHLLPKGAPRTTPHRHEPPRGL